ncbi:hypothetical protein R3P38DRAFT_2762296 [Favolaschia claudopus]|uniref:Uncharacterized protein n=1 Tax=Favolaschia claudopus TaxID=2862362 RepID=A0AAW0DK52_9AGAR
MLLPAHFPSPLVRSLFRFLCSPFSAFLQALPPPPPRLDLLTACSISCNRPPPPTNRHHLTRVGPARASSNRPQLPRSSSALNVATSFGAMGRRARRRPSLPDADIATLDDEKPEGAHTASNSRQSPVLQITPPPPFTPAPLAPDSVTNELFKLHSPRRLVPTPRPYSAAQNSRRVASQVPLPHAHSTAALPPFPRCHPRLIDPFANYTVTRTPIRVTSQLTPVLLNSAAHLARPPRRLVTRKRPGA